MKLKLPLLLECFMRFVSVFEASVLYQKSCLQCNNIISGFFCLFVFSRYICVKKKPIPHVEVLHDGKKIWHDGFRLG